MHMNPDIRRNYICKWAKGMCVDTFTSLLLTLGIDRLTKRPEWNISLLISTGTYVDELTFNGISSI